MEKYSARQHFFGCRGAWRDEGATATARTGWDEPVTGQRAAHEWSGDADLRTSDAERQAAADELKAHFEAGRISMDEFDERLQVALTARTRRDLADVLQDLPLTRPPSAPGPRHRDWPLFVPVLTVVGLMVVGLAVAINIAFGPFGSLHHFIFPGWIVPIGLFFGFRWWRRGCNRGSYRSGPRASLN